MAQFSQYTLPDAPPQNELNIHPAPNGSILSDGSFQSPNYVTRDRGWKVDSEGNAEFQNVSVSSGKLVGTNGIAITPTSKMTLQQALDYVYNTFGTGEVRLSSGTFSQTGNVVGYSGVSIIGENQGTTIIDFGSTASNLSFTGSNVYTTGTLSSILAGLVVTGSGTSWLTNAAAGMMIFIGKRWYSIGSVDSDTQITLAEFCNDFVSGSYRIAVPVYSVRLREFTVKSSTGSGIKFTDCRNVIIERVSGNQNNVGIEFDNVSELSLTATLAIANASHGFDLSGVGLFAANSCLANNNGGNGWGLTSCDDFALVTCTGQNNAGDGGNVTSCSDGSLTNCAMSGNGGQGVELVSGNSGILCGFGNYNNNVSDGIKLTATSDGCSVTNCNLVDNGGYGINIAAASCDNNTIIVPYFENNALGSYNDDGTGTNIVATVPQGFQFTGSKVDGLTQTVANATMTRDLLSTDVQYSTGGSWRLDSGTLGQATTTADFNWQNTNYIYTTRLRCPDANTWSGSTGGRSYFWGLAESGFTSGLTQSANQKTNGLIIDESLVGFLVGGDNKLYAVSGTGEVTTGVTGQASMEVTDLSAYEHNDFHDYKITTSYASFPTISNSGFVRPTAHSGGNSNQANMYDTDTNSFGFAERQSGVFDAVALSWDGGITYTAAINNSIPVSKTVTTIGGQYDTWGRTWSASDFSDANFRLKFGGLPASSFWGGTFSNSITFSSFGFDTSTWVHITGVEVELTSETEDEGDGGVAEHKIYDIRVKVYFTTTENTGSVKYYIDDSLVATHKVSIPRNTDNPKILFASVNGRNESDEKLILFNNYQLTANII